MADNKYYTREEVDKLLQETKAKILQEINDTIIFNHEDPGILSVDKSLFFKFVDSEKKKIK